MLKVVTVVGTRPEIIKLSRVIYQLDQYTEHILVHTGQNYDYELNKIFFNEMNIRKPDIFLEVASETPAKAIANVISESDKVFETILPDVLLIYGDTNSCLCVISAKRRQIPIFHMEAGNRCFDYRVPEEINRKIVDHTSDINMTISAHAKENLIAEGIPANQIICIGSCMKEVLEFYQKKIDTSTILKHLLLQKNDYFIVSIHREENLDIEENIEHLSKVLNSLASIYKKPIIFSTHPRTMKKIEKQKKYFSPLVQVHKPFGFFDYIHLQEHSFCVVSDSGTLSEEASLLNFPAVTIRMAHERSEGMDNGVFTMSSMESNDVVERVNIATSLVSQQIPASYDEDNVSGKVIKIIYSYVNFVNKILWKK